MARGRGPTQPPELKITLDKTEPNKRGDVWNFTIIVSVLRGKNPEAGKEIQLFLGGNYVATVYSDSNGRATQDFTLPEGNHTFEGILSVEPDKRHKIFASLFSGKKFPADLDVNSEGKDGNYAVNMTIVDGEGKAIAGVVKIMTGGKWADVPAPSGDVVITFKDGKCRGYPGLKLHDRPQDVKFSVVGTVIDKELRLSGPRKKPKSSGKSFSEIFSEVEDGFRNRSRNGWRITKKLWP